MNPAATQIITNAIHNAEEVKASRALSNDDERPRLLIEAMSPDRTVLAVRDVLAQAGGLFDRGGPARVVFDDGEKGAAIQPLSPDDVVLHVHRVSRPYKLRRDGEDWVEEDARLSRPDATMYLGLRGEWGLPVLNGISTAPLLRYDGAILAIDGYDATSGFWCECVPDLGHLVALNPTKEEALRALQFLRDNFKTFPFADAQTVKDVSSTLDIVDLSKPPGRDESCFLAALLTAICRPSLPLAPGILLRAPQVSGAGAGKGLLARCMCVIAFGKEPHAVTSGGNNEELEKRLAAELMQGGPAVFLDNLNHGAVKSELLASAITERPARVRVLGKSQMVALNASAFIVLTGNGLTVSEDLARRFISIELDPRIEDPETREFPLNILREIHGRRTEYMSALLTIWRWGRQSLLPSGIALGSFDEWCSWVRDPLIALGCSDPVARVSEAKERDAQRQDIAGIFSTWWEAHGDRAVAASELAEAVQLALNPQKRSRQFVVARLEKLVGTRVSGFVLDRQASIGTWGRATFALRREDYKEQHRGHRDRSDRTFEVMPPMPPMLSDALNGPTTWREEL